MKHWFAHLFGWNTGTVETFYVSKVLYVGFKCRQCGEINHVLPSERTPYWEAFDYTAPDNDTAE